MKKLFALLFLVAALTCQGATPSYQNFDPGNFFSNSFQIYLSAGVSNDWKSYAMTVSNALYNYSAGVSNRTVGVVTQNFSQVFTSSVGIQAPYFSGINGSPPTITTNAPTLLSSVVLTPGSTSSRFGVTWITSAATQVAFSNYFTINLTDPVLSANPVFAVISNMGTNQPVGTAPGLIRWTIICTSNQIIFVPVVAPGASTGHGANGVVIK